MKELEYKKHIMAKANKVKTEKELSALIKEITKYNHDYGTIVHACMAAMKAAFNVVNASPQGGITGFQAGCLGWECIREFMWIEGPARIQKYDDMLYPQYEDKFDKLISEETWDHLQKKARKNLLESKQVHESVKSHWQKIATGTVPFGYRVQQ